jgi:hypothetical protein
VRRSHEMPKQTSLFQHFPAPTPAYAFASAASFRSPLAN